MIDGAVRCQCAKALGEARPNMFCSLYQTFAFNDRKVGKRGSTNRGVTRVCVAVAQEKIGVRLERFFNCCTHIHATEWLITRSNALGEAQHVGSDAVMIGCEPCAHATEPRDHFIEDKKRTVLIAQLACAFQISGRWWPHTACALQRFDNDCSNLLAVVAHELCQVFEVVAVYLHNLGQQLSETLFV